MIIKSPETNEEIESYYDLRWRILRAPLNKPKPDPNDKNEKNSFKVIALDEHKKVVGTGRAIFNSEQEAQIYSMTVEENLRGKGIGSLILSELEKRIKEKGARTLVIDSRDSAVEFYKTRGYSVLKESYVLSGKIKHFTMTKKLE